MQWETVIAISYRREDSKPVAGRLYDRLQTEFGKENVFMDFDSIPYGVDFREHIDQTLQKASVLVAIIGPDWAGGRAGSGKRIEESADFVRLEIASALQHGIPIIPVLVDNTPMPDAKTLPPDIEGLAFRNGLDLDTGIDFHHHADRLIAGIRRVLDKNEDGVVANAGAGSASRARTSRAVAITVAAVAGLICAGAGVAWLARSGGHATSAIPTPSPVVSQSPSANESLGEHSYRGKVGPYDATFQLRFSNGGHVSGTYVMDVNKALTLRLQGSSPPGRLLLDEYTPEKSGGHETLTAHIDLNLKSSGSEVRWEGMMYNVHPNTNTYSVSFARSR